MNITIGIIVLIFIAFDVLTGWLKALATGTTDSSIMRKGLFHKLGEIVAMIFGYVCQYTLPYVGVTVNIPFAVAIGTYIVLMEIASIIENISKMNPAMGKVLGNVFSDDTVNLPEESGAEDEEQFRDS